MTAEIAILDPGQMQAAIDYAERLAYSGLIPDVYQGRPANILWAMEYGRTLGLSTLAAINGVNVIKGKPTASAGLIGALVRRAGHQLRIGYDTDTMTGWAEIVRCDDPEFTFRSEWDVERAVEAELCILKDGKPFAVDSKGNTLPWKKFYPSMVKARATTEVARDACEEVLFGLHYTPEELGAQVDEDGVPVEQVLEAVARKAERERIAAQQDADAEAPQTDEKPKASNNSQRTKLILLVRDKRGITDDAEQRAVLSELLGREIASRKDITSGEAHRLIEALSAEKDHIADAEVVPEPSQPNPRNGDAPVSPAVEAALSSPTPGIQPQVPAGDPAAVRRAREQVAQDSARERNGSWSHRMAASRGTPLTTRADGSDQLFEDMMIAVADATTVGELEGLYLAAKHAHDEGKISDEQFAKLDKLGYAANEDLRAAVGAGA